MDAISSIQESKAAHCFAHRSLLLGHTSKHAVYVREMVVGGVVGGRVGVGDGAGVGGGEGGGFGARECFEFLEVFLDVFFSGGGGGVFDLFFPGNAEAVSLNNKRLMIMADKTVAKTEGNFLLERREEYRTIVWFGAKLPISGAAAAAMAASVDVIFIMLVLPERKEEVWDLAPPFVFSL